MTDNSNEHSNVADSHLCGRGENKMKPPESRILHQTPSYIDLKNKQRSIRTSFPSSLGLRVHRSLSWLGRSQNEVKDADVRFILLWVGFNAAYAIDVGQEASTERGIYGAYFETLVSLDIENRIYRAVWNRFPHEIRLLLNNEFTFAPFWNHHNGLIGYDNWPDRLSSSKKIIADALANRDTVRILSIVFDRLYVLRNQLIHGGSTWNSSVNRSQVTDGVAVIGALLPLFIDIMMDNPSRDWGKPYYPLISP